MKRILVVEDLLTWRDNLLRSLKKIPDCEVDSAGDLEQAMRMVQLGRFDLALVDWNLTDIDGNHDGERFIQYLKQVAPGTQVIVVSGTIPATDATLGPTVRGFVNKADLNLRELRQKVQSLLVDGPGDKETPPCES
jgi:CheY-like chemotaxis protein